MATGIVNMRSYPDVNPLALHHREPKKSGNELFLLQWPVAEHFIDVNLTPTSPRGGAVALTDKLS